MTTASTGFSWLDAAADRAIAAATASALALTAGTKSAMTESTPGSASSSGRTLFVRGLGRRSQHVDGIGEARLFREQRREGSNRVLGERGQLEPRGFARVGAQDPEAAGVRQHRDPAASRHRLCREQRSHVDELLERARADDARLVEERVDRGLRAGERGGVRARRTSSGARCSALHGENWLRASDAAGESSRTCRGLPNDSR